VSGDPIAAGTSSFGLIDREAFLAALGLREGMTVVDLACGAGNYAFAIAPALGPCGRVWAVDLWEEGVRAVEVRAAREGAATVAAIRADIARAVPLPDGAADLTLLATVLHDLVEDGTDQGALAEARRLTRTGGALAVVEFKVADGPPGPPRRIRIAPERTEELVVPFGFAPAATVDLGPHAYLSLFVRAAG
jgi:ubiquinone/menaquinone biosynthesis C-methylase UbiE